MPLARRPSRAQQYLLPPSIDEWVPPDHPVRFVSDFVDQLNLKDLGIDEPEASGNIGRPAYPADVLLKVWLFGYMERVRSTRKLEKACVESMPFLWLTVNEHPDHNTLWRFFSANRQALPKLFKHLTRTAAAAGLVGFVLHALDGTKLTAASSTDTAIHRKSINEALKKLDEFVKDYVQAVNADASQNKGGGYAMPAEMADSEARMAKIRAMLERQREDREAEEAKQAAQSRGARSEPKQKPLPGTEEPAGNARPDDGPKKGAKGHDGQGREAKSEPKQKATPGGQEPPADVAAKVEPPAPAKPSDPLLHEAELLKQQLEAKLKILDDAHVHHLHAQEPEARAMRGRSMSGMGYNAQIVVDRDSDMIVACEVVADQNDTSQLVPMLEAVQANFERVADETVADAGYDSSHQLLGAEQRKLPVIVGLREASEPKGVYSKRHFRFDAEKNVYICPQGERLVVYCKNKAHKSSLQADTIYYCKTKGCPVRAMCTTSRHHRQVRRPFGEEARERQLSKQASPAKQALFGLRKEIVEHVFALVKTRDTFTRFTMRGIEKVRAQWSMVCMAVDLRKLWAVARWRGPRLERRPLPA